MHPKFDSLTTTAGLEIIDPIETRRFTFRTAGRVEPTPTGTEEFAFPVAKACEIRTDGFALPYTVPVTIRTRDGTFKENLSPPASSAFPNGEYLVELDAPIKIYFRVDSLLGVEVNTDDVVFDFGEEAAVRVGARSFHNSPAETITVPDDPEAMMEAVSAFSSALKTTSPERSWPTLRGHPPRVERGDELDIPDHLEAPDTGITIEIPPEYGQVYAVAPLAYYLGADVVPGDTPVLTADAGVIRYLGDDATEVSETAGELLKRVLLLDCVTRTEGYYSIDLHERNVLEPQVDLDFAEVYDATPSERLATYLSVPDEAVESITPTWHRVTHVEPTPDAVELLPYVVKDLSIVRIEPQDETVDTPTESQRVTEEAIGSFVRRTTPTEDFVRSAGTRRTRSRTIEEDDGEMNAAERGIPGVGEYVPLPDVDAMEQVYVGDKTPEGGAKLLPEAFENDAPEPTEGVIEITVVCNDEEMREEWDAVSEIYGDRDDVYVDVDYRFAVPTDELRDLLTDDNDLFHFIGHIDGLGFECPDGILDANTIEETAATAVLLNGCRSHNQGIALIEAGANAAVVSLGDIGNEGAIEVGETLGRLLHHGFSVGKAMEIVREYTSIGKNYLVVGNPGMVVAHIKDGIPVLYRISVKRDSSECDEFFTVEPVAYPTSVRNVGSLLVPYLSSINSKHVAVGPCYKTSISKEEFMQAFLEDKAPMVLDGELVWSDVWLQER